MCTRTRYEHCGSTAAAAAAAVTWAREHVRAIVNTRASGEYVYDTCMIHN